jgi:hypothetical protein
VVEYNQQCSNSARGLNAQQPFFHRSIARLKKPEALSRLSFAHTA